MNYWFQIMTPTHIKEDDYRFASELSAKRIALKYRMWVALVLGVLSMYVISQNSYFVFGIHFDSSQPVKVLFTMFKFMWVVAGFYIYIGFQKLSEIGDDQMRVDKVLRINEQEEYEAKIRSIREKEEREVAAIRRRHAQENKD